MSLWQECTTCHKEKLIGYVLQYENDPERLGFRARKIGGKVLPMHVSKLVCFDCLARAIQNEMQFTNNLTITRAAPQGM